MCTDQTKTIIWIHKGKAKGKIGIGSLQKGNGCFTLDECDTAEEINFLNPPLHIKIPTFQLFLSECHLLSHISITETMVLDKLLSLNSSKATGPENLHLHLLKSYVIYEQLWQFLLNNGLSISCQHGFVNKKFCFTNLLDVYNDWIPLTSTFHQEVSCDKLGQEQRYCHLS